LGYERGQAAATGALAGGAGELVGHADGELLGSLSHGGILLE
jgi:hypothetical protein